MENIMTLTAENYYYNQLNKEQKKVYYAMKEGLLKMEESFQLLKLSNRELADIYILWFVWIARKYFILSNLHTDIILILQWLNQWYLDKYLWF